MCRSLAGPGQESPRGAWTERLGLFPLSGSRARCATRQLCRNKWGIRAVLCRLCGLFSPIKNRREKYKGTCYQPQVQFVGPRLFAAIGHLQPYHQIAKVQTDKARDHKPTDWRQASIQSIFTVVSSCICITLVLHWNMSGERRPSGVCCVLWCRVCRQLALLTILLQQHGI